MRRSSIVVISAFICGLLAGHLITRAGWPEKGAAKDAEVKKSPTRQFAEKLVVSRIDFEATPISEAVDYLRSQSRSGIEMDGQPTPFRLNFVVADPDHLSKPIDLRLKSVSLDRVCEHVAQAAGLHVSFETDAIVFSSGK